MTVLKTELPSLIPEIYSVSGLDVSTLRQRTVSIQGCGKKRIDS